MVSGTEPRQIDKDCDQAHDDAYDLGYMLGFRGQEKPKTFKLTIGDREHEIQVFRSAGQYAQTLHAAYKKGVEARKSIALEVQEQTEWAISHSELALRLSGVVA